MNFKDEKINLLRTKNLFQNGISYTKPRESAVFEYENHTAAKPLISVIIPTFMEEKILRDNLKIFTSERKNLYSLELIISDGGSTDKTVEIAREFADIIIKHNKPGKQTISEGRNRGAAVASGETLVFLNADTTPENPDYFFRYIYRWSRLDSRHKKENAIATYVTSFPEETILKDKIFYFLHNLYVKSLNMLGVGIGRGECQVISKELFFDVGCYNEKIVAGEDFDLYRRIAKKSKIKFASNLVVYESPRRFRKLGYFRVIWQWIINALSVIFRGKSVSRDWEAVR